MWAMAASLSSQFQHLRDVLYREALERLKVLELSSHPAEDDASRLEQAQAWMLVAVYELMRVGFHRAWASAGRAIRLVQLMRLNEIDADGAAAEATCNQTGEVITAQDSEAFVETEIKRRTFWMALCIDRCCCVLDELPLTLSEQGVCQSVLYFASRSTCNAARGDRLRPRVQHERPLMLTNPPTHV